MSATDSNPHDLAAAAELAAFTGLLTQYFELAVEQLENPTAEAAATILTNLETRLALVLNASADPSTQLVARMVQQQLLALRSRTPQIAETALTRRALEQTVQAFLAAVNKEDKEQASQLLTKTSASHLVGLPSLRDAIGQAPGTQEVRLARIGQIRDGQVVVHLSVVAADGSIASRQFPMAYQQTNGVVRLGEKD